MKNYSILLLVYSLIVLTAGQDPDPTILMPVGPLFGTKQFYITPSGSNGEFLTWLEGLHHCQEHGMDLAEFSDLAEMQAIGDILMDLGPSIPSLFWVGADVMEDFRVAIVPSSNYTWFVTGETVPNELWAVSEPSRQRFLMDGDQFDYESCAIFNESSNELISASCFEWRPSLCQKLTPPAPVDNPPVAELTWFLDFEEKKFYHSPTDKIYNWIGALHYCRKYGMQLADISSLHELQFVRSTLSQDPATNWINFWLGGNVMDQFREPDPAEVNYKWFTTGELVNDSFWATSEPSRDLTLREVDQVDYESCMELDPSRPIGLQTGSCFELRPVICQKLLETTQPPTTTTRPTTHTPAVGCGLRDHITPFDLLDPQIVIRLPQPLAYSTAPGTQIWRAVTWNVVSTLAVAHPSHNRYLTGKFASNGNYWFETSPQFPQFRQLEGMDSSVLTRGVSMKCRDGSSVRYRFAFDLVEPTSPTNEPATPTEEPATPTDEPATSKDGPEVTTEESSTSEDLAP